MFESLFKPKEYHKTCRICGKDFIGLSWCACYCSKECRKIGYAQYMKNYRPAYMKKFRADPGRLEDYRIRHREWNKTRKGRIVCRRAANKYAGTEHGKKIRKKIQAEWYKKNHEYALVDARERYYDKCWWQYYKDEFKR